MRIGIGYDIHQLVEGRELILGGVSIPFEKGLLGHSDADVLTHALIDALLGALALGTIGDLFPDTDPQYKDADSLKLLEQCLHHVKQKGYRLVNMDSVIVAERPKLAPHIPEIKAQLSRVLQHPAEDISVKATRGETLGFEGRGEGMSARVVVLLQKT